MNDIIQMMDESSCFRSVEGLKPLPTVGQASIQTHHVINIFHDSIHEGVNNNDMTARYSLNSNEEINPISRTLIKKEKLIISIHEDAEME